jgi:transaldolase
MSRRNWKKRSVLLIAAALGCAAALTIGSGACKKETSSEKAGREAREAYEKSKDLLKEGLDKTKDLTKESVQKSQEAAKDFQKGWKEGGTESGK